MSRAFDESLVKLKQYLLKMGEKVEIALDKSIRSFANQEIFLAQEVIDHDKEIDQLEEKIDEYVAKLIATQQPVAKNMRKLVAALKIVSDLERMGDLAVDIAEVTIQMRNQKIPPIRNDHDIREMARLTQSMVHDGINSYITGNIQLAKKIAELDDQVDQMNYNIIRNTTISIHVEDYPESYFLLCFVAHYLERIGDHVTNIAESVIYIETGKYIDLN
ncbi:phosphate signaling complex protein PhoU [Thermoflavimicrobium daqui]|jgi:phosphate transport system protein|uniref:Phosphate-specific transport system accessory protein PhoU n=1 Tax=Thermoflavimicrobium daqui TaxID=2137476 RepID=A0A364K970_9BACL|nr:phosphate signaling complex protein PhoU [Thermoflavimicrobium daqui]RAL26828.1 phosphate transport system regulatory protein PhoU [Thermoflavimicrobium daqui]